MSIKQDITIHDFENICRTCLSKDNLKPLYEKCFASTRLIDMLMTGTVVKFAEDDGLPAKICTNCICEIKQAFTFAKHCEITDEILRRCVENSKTELANNSLSYQTVEQTIQAEEEMKIEVKQEVLEHYEYVGIIEQENDVKHECTTELILPKEEKVLVDFEYAEEVTQEEGMNIENENDETDDDPAYESYVEDDDEDPYSEKSENSGSLSKVHSSTPLTGCQEKEKDVKIEFTSGYILPTVEKILEDSEYEQEVIQEEGVNIDNESEETDDPMNKSDDEDQESISKKNKRQYACDVCGKKLCRLSSLQTHKLIHTGEKPHVCFICSKAFAHPQGLQYHMRIHTGERPYTCEICSKSFTYPNVFKEHMRLHTGNKRYTCEFCSKTFNGRPQFEGHMRLHTGERPYVCSICSKGFTQSHILTNHMKVHSIEKPFSCEVCSKTFRSFTHLKSHKKIHTGEKPHICPLCSNGFAHPQGLKCHMRTHTGEKPYICSVCNRAFGQAHTLQKHMRLHTGEKPYSCRVCSKRFAQNGGLSLHIRKCLDKQK